jgi:MtN3 and saliva related transmembrane protein
MQPDGISLIGFVAAVLTTTSLLPQVIKSLKMKETKDISLLMYVILATGMFLWMVYGFLLHNLPLITANGISLALVMVILIFKIKYG